MAPARDAPDPTARDPEPSSNRQAPIASPCKHLARIKNVKASLLISIVLLAALVTILGTGSVTPAQVDPDADAASNRQVNEPRIVVVQKSGSRPGGHSGLLLAIWDDGKMLIPAALNNPSAELLLCECDKESVAEFVRQFDKLQSRKVAEFPIMLGSAITLVRVRTKDGNLFRLGWDLVMRPEFLARNEDPEQYMASIDAWFRIQSMIWQIVPTKIELLKDHLDDTKRYRGFDPKNPFDVDWMY